MKYTIFYSWQSDTEPDFNWNLIRDSINSAIKNIENKGQLKGVFFNDLQESTSNVPGSPDTVQTIEERIDNCDIFIGDLTITNSHPRILEFLKNNSDIPYKFSPNSNVYGEYNWAFSKHGSKAIIAVMNTFYGDPKKNPQIIPFDIRQKRFPFSYYCDSEMQIEEASLKLISFFENAIRESILKIIDDERYRYIPFITFAEHKKEYIPKCEYCSNASLDVFKNNILNNDSNIRLLGISGIGKTRLVIEAIKNSPEHIARYLYCDCFIDDFEEVKKKIELILRKKENPLIVLDNCNTEQAQFAIRIKRRYSSTNCKVITIWNQEERSTLEGFAYINLNVDLHDVVDEIINKKSINISDENKNLIKEFSDGIPLMAILLIESINEGNTDIGKLTNKDFVNKLIFEEKEEREIIKSCSLFRYIGFEGDFRSQIKFIIENKAITPINGESEVKLAQFDKLFNKYKKREIVETNGRLFGIRPRPLAFALAEEWFEDCSDERMENVIKSIQDENNPNSKILTESLCAQIKYLGNNERVKSLIEKLTNIHGPFDNAEVLNTELGSRLFRSFVEVNPIAVANNLFRLFGSMSIEQLKKIEEGRRNLVWTLEKLCFDKTTFDLGAKLMMSFAIAENESWGNNSTAEFLHLFKIQLAGTEANLYDRLEIVKWGLEKGNEYTLMSLKALNSALTTQNFTRFIGAEIQGTRRLKDYSPSYDEILKYWTDILEILDKYIDIPEYFTFCCEIISNHIRGLSRAGVVEMILPLIRKVVERLNYDWELILDRLYDVKKYDFNYLNSEEQLKIIDLIELLTKNDFYSRFAAVEKYRKRSDIKIDFNDSIKIQQNKYLELANEFVNDEFCSFEILHLIYSNRHSFSTPFGSRIAELIETDFEKVYIFIDISLEILISIEFKNRNSSIIIDFARGLKQDKTRDYLVNSLLNRKELSYLLFPIFGVFNYGFEKLRILFALIENNDVAIGEFKQYFSYYPLHSYSEFNFPAFINKIKEYGIKGLNTAFQILHNLLYYNDNIFTDLGLVALLEDLIISINFSKFENIDENEFYDTIETLLKKGDSKSFPVYINKEVIKLAKDPNSSFSFHYGLENIYKILISQYFTEIWTDLSDALLSEGEDYFVYYNLQHLLGSHIGNTHKEVGILFSGNIEKIFDWCKINPIKAPARLASMVPIFGNEGFHPITQRLIDEFGEMPDVLDNLRANMGSFSWVGSIIPLLKSKRKLYESLINHSKIEVREWAQRNIGYTDQEILREVQREEEQKFLYN